MSRVRFDFALAIAALLSSCSGEEPQSVAGPPLFAKNPPAVSTQWVVDDLAGLASDGRGAYVDGECGVSALVFPGGGGNGQLRPADSRSRCGYTRAVPVTVGTLQVGITGMSVLGIWGIPSGSTAAADFVVNTGAGTCALLKYNAETGARVQVAAGTNGAGKRTWVVESISPHAAGCYVFSQGQHAWDGIQRSVPVRFTITAR